MALLLSVRFASIFVDHETLEEGGAAITPLLQSTAAKVNNQPH